MKKRTLFLAMTALMITMTSGGSLTAVYADEIPTEAAETSESTELPIKPLTAKIVDENIWQKVIPIFTMTATILTLQMRCFLLISIQKSMFLMRRQIQMLLLQSFLTLTDMP